MNKKIEKPWGVCLGAYVVRVIEEYDDIVHIEFSDRSSHETWESRYVKRFETIDEAVNELSKTSERPRELIAEIARCNFKV